MASNQTIFAKLRTMETEGKPLHALIVDACDAGDELVAALDAVTTFAAAAIDRLKLTDTNGIVAAANAALARAYPDNNHTNGNGARAA